MPGQWDGCVDGAVPGGTPGCCTHWWQMLRALSCAVGHPAVLCCARVRALGDGELGHPRVLCRSRGQTLALTTAPHPASVSPILHVGRAPVGWAPRGLWVPKEET